MFLRQQPKSHFCNTKAVSCLEATSESELAQSACLTSSGVHSLFDDVVPSERYMGVIFGLISEKHRAMVSPFVSWKCPSLITQLKRIALYRRPVICVGGDVTELKFITNEQFDLTSDLPLGPDDGSIILRLETRLDKHIRIPVTRTLVWERYQVRVLLSFS